jgi:SAM-dependent methyltransferase
MPEISWNKLFWDGQYEWPEAGEEWSETWGGSEAQWFGCLYPRIHRLLPARKILEIAPGYGRWTKYLLRECTEKLVGVDLSEECVQACRKYFAKVPYAEFVSNDGVSLDMVKDGTFDLVFSYDSRVHVEMDVHNQYIPQMIRKLTKCGAAFIHHSNMAEAGDVVTGNSHVRAKSVSAGAIAKLVKDNGGVVLIQETHDWGGSGGLIDCITVFARKDGIHKGRDVCLKNHHFMDEAELIKKYQGPYSHGIEVNPNSSQSATGWLARMRRLLGY